MSELTSSDLTYAALPDPWERAGPIPLDGVLERNQYSPLLVAFVALIIGMAGYMIVGTIATVVLLMLGGVGLEDLAADMPGVMEDQVAAVLGANAIGLFLGLGLVALLLVRLHSSRRWAFLRLRKPDATALVLSLFGLIALIPVVQWAGSINELLPLPEWLKEMEQAQKRPPSARMQPHQKLRICPASWKIRWPPCWGPTLSGCFWAWAWWRCFWCGCIRAEGGRFCACASPMPRPWCCRFSV